MKNAILLLLVALVVGCDSHQTSDSMQKKILFSVDDTFTVGDRGRVVTSDITVESAEIAPRRNDRVLLLTPDGTSTETRILAVEQFEDLGSRKEKFGVMLPASISTDQTPKGTKVFRLE